MATGHPNEICNGASEWAWEWVALVFKDHSLKVFFQLKKKENRSTAQLSPSQKMGSNIKENTLG